MAACVIWSTANSAWCARRLREREVLLRAAPHLIRPLRFVLPINEARRSADAVAARASALRLDRLAQDPAGNARTRSCDRRGRPAAQAPLPSCLRIFRLFCRRCAARRAQRGRCRRTRRGDPHPHPLRARRAQRYLAACSQCPRPARRRDGAGPGQCGRRLERNRSPRPCCAQSRRSSAAARQGQSHRGAAAIRSRSRLHPAGRRSPGCVRHSVSARFYADRHHRPELSPAIRRPCCRAAKRSIICAAS